MPVGEHMLLRESHTDRASYTFALFAPPPGTVDYEYIPFEPSSTQELDLSSQVTFLPNPVDDYMSIRSEEQFTQARLSLYDVAGRLHKQMDITSDTRVDMTSCLLYTSPSPRDATLSRMPSSA